MQVVRRIVVTLHCIFQRFEIALNLVHKDLRRMIRVSLLQVHNAFHSFAQVTYFKPMKRNNLSIFLQRI